MLTRFRYRLRRAVRILLAGSDFDPETAGRVAWSVSADIGHRLHDRLILFGRADAGEVMREMEEAVLDGLREYDTWRDIPEDDGTPIPF